MENAHLMNRGEGRASRCLHCRKSRLLRASLAVLATAGASHAALVTWTGSAGDSFNDGTKWNTATVPGTADVAVFNNSTNGDINFAASVNPLGVRFSNTNGVVNLALAGNTLTFGNAVDNGTLALGSAAGQVNSVVISGGPIVHANGTLNFAVVGFSGSNGNSLKFTGAATQFNAASSGGAFAAIGVANSNNNQLVVDNGALVNWRGTVNVGVIGGTAATSSSGNLVKVNSATFNMTGGSRGLNLRNGTLEFTKSYMDTGFIDADDAGNSSTIIFNSGEIYSRATRVDNGRNFVIGDGGTTPAIFGLAYSTGTATIGTTVAPVDMVLSSNAVLTGGGAGTITVAAGGKLRGSLGAKVSPSIIGQPVLTTDDRNTGTLNFVGAWDNTDINLVMDVGNFPAGAAAIPSFIPLDNIRVTGAFTHGGKVSFDMAGFVGPTGPDTEYKVVSWTTEVGLSSSTSVEFINGGSLPYRFDSTGLYLMVPEPASLSAVALLGCLFGGRRLSRRKNA